MTKYFFYAYDHTAIQNANTHALSNENEKANKMAAKQDAVLIL